MVVVDECGGHFEAWLAGADDAGSEVGRLSTGGAWAGPPPGPGRSAFAVPDRTASPATGLL